MLTMLASISEGLKRLEMADTKVLTAIGLVRETILSELIFKSIPNIAFFLVYFYESTVYTYDSIYLIEVIPGESSFLLYTSNSSNF
jgi:hypothetical protein